VFGLSSTIRDASTDLLTPQSDASTTQASLPSVVKGKLKCPSQASGQNGLGQVQFPTQSGLSPIVELSSDSEEEPLRVHHQSPSTSFPLQDSTRVVKLESTFVSDTSPISLNLSRPPLYPIDKQFPSVMRCL
jgi:hypothetical protein